MLNLVLKVLSNWNSGPVGRQRMLSFGASRASKGGWTDIRTWKKQRQASRGHFFSDLTVAGLPVGKVLPSLKWKALSPTVSSFWKCHLKHRGVSPSYVHILFKFTVKISHHILRTHPNRT